MNFSNDDNKNYKRKYLKYKAKYAQLKGGSLSSLFRGNTLLRAAAPRFAVRNNSTIRNRTFYAAFGGGGDIKNLFPLIQKQVIDNTKQNKVSVIDVWISTFAHKNTACWEARNFAEDFLKKNNNEEKKIKGIKHTLTDGSEIEFITRKIHSVIKSPEYSKTK